MTNEAPDKNCYTLPNGDCIGVDCMHNRRDKSPIIGSRPTVEDLAVALKALDEDVQLAVMEVAKAERWAQVPEGTTRTLIEALSRE